MSGAVTDAPTIRLLCWNMGAGGPGPTANWGDVLGQDDIDACILQEAPNPWGGSAVVDTVPAPGSRWGITGINRAQTAIARLSDRVSIEPIAVHPLGFDGPLELGVSRPGTLTVAKLTVGDTGEEILLASIYAQWEGPMSGGPGIFADASMHRLLSDLSPLLSWRDYPVIVAGDFNHVLGAAVDDTYGANWTARNDAVFARLGSLGLRLAGPQAPNGEQADPRPGGLPGDTKNVPTFRFGDNAVRQLDYCYVSEDLVDRVSVIALNRSDEWGPSDHCRLRIEVGPPRVRRWNEQSFLAEIAAAHGGDAERAVADMLAWAHRHALRIEFSEGPEGQVWAQLDDGPAGLQWSFSVRTRGDVVVQFQHMTEPFDTVEARDEVRTGINDAIAGAEIPAERLEGRPTIALRRLVDDETRTAFLAVFADLVEKSRAAKPRVPQWNEESFKSEIASAHDVDAARSGSRHLHLGASATAPPRVR